jgi:RNA polymerase sigma factor
MRTGRLPLKKIKDFLKTPQKILERYRKYIITAILIAKGDYPGMYEYLNLK